MYIRMRDIMEIKNFKKKGEESGKSGGTEEREGKGGGNGEKGEINLKYIGWVKIKSRKNI